MEASYWHERWGENRIAFHEEQANALLVQFFDRLELGAGARVFVPLCGKSRDIGWLLSRGCRVVGIELSEIAVRQLFDELGVEPEVKNIGELKHFKAPDLEIFAGDIFELSGDLLGEVEAVYDRAALVALPEDMRLRYVKHVTEITGAAKQLVITFNYDQSVIPGPPFSIETKEIEGHFAETYAISPLDSVEVEGRLKGKVDALENLWLLTPSPLTVR